MSVSTDNSIPDFALDEEKPPQVEEVSRSLPFAEFYDCYASSLPQAFRIETSNEDMEDMREGDLLVACILKKVLVMRARKPDSGRMVTIPINSAISFALLPEHTDEVDSLGANWEGIYTVSEMLKLPSLPPAAKVLTDCKDSNKKKVSKGVILYNLSICTSKVFKRKGIVGESSYRVPHRFTEGDDVQFSTKQVDTKCYLVEFYDIFRNPLRARVFCEGGTELKNNEVILFEKKEEKKFLMVTTVNSEELPRNVLYIPVDNSDLQVTAVNIKGYSLELLTKQKATLKRQCSSRIVLTNDYVDTPIHTTIRDEPKSPTSEDPCYDYVYHYSISDTDCLETMCSDSEGYANVISRRQCLKLMYTHAGSEKHIHKSSEPLSRGLGSVMPIPPQNQDCTYSLSTSPEQASLKEPAQYVTFIEPGPAYKIPDQGVNLAVIEDIAQTCFVLGDVHTLPITHLGGTFPLHPFGPCGGEQQVECCATLEAPPGVVGSGVTVSVHYAIILDGPFLFPEEWERTSVVLYIDCPDSKFLIEPLTVNLHHWAVSSGTSRMCFMKSSHLLQKGQAKFTFQCHANVIPSQPNVASVYLKDHFCLVCTCVAATSDTMVMSRYYGILLSDPLKYRVEKFWLCITYAVPSWVQAVAEYYRRSEGSEGCCEIPEYEEMQISYGNKVKVDMENGSGLGWTLSVTKKEALLRDVDSLSRYTSCTEKEKAVRIGSYPPSVKFRVTYDTVPSPETHKPIPKIACLSSESNDTISLSFVVQEEKAKDPIIPSAAITDVNMLSSGHVQGSWTETTDSSQDGNHLVEPSKPLTVQHLMPYINDLADKVVSISGWLGMGRELEVIKRTPGTITPEDQLQELLKKWLEDTECPTAPHTWKNFVRVVREVRKGYVADRIVEDVFKDEEMPSDPASLEQFIVSRMSDKWFQFGINLGVAEKTLKDLDGSDLIPDNIARCVVMLHHWIREAGPIENNMTALDQAMKQTLTKEVKGVLTDMVDQGKPCLKCGGNCPGFELHFWRKVCKHCLHTRAEHDMQDEDGLRSITMDEILFSSDVVGPSNNLWANKMHSPITAKVLNGEIDSLSKPKREKNYLWVPKNVTKVVAEKYLNGLPREKCPVKGTPGERYHNQQLINQFPAYDMDIGQMRQDLSDEEKKQMELFLKMRRDDAFGRGQIMEKETIEQKWFCMKCSEDLEVGDVAVFTTEGNAWHPACFTCFKCEELLIDLIYFSHDGGIYCGRHHAELIKRRCSGCDELILCQEYTRAEERNWHLHHFTCIACDMNLGGQRYVVHDENMYCLKCNDKYFLKTCQKCNKIVTPDDSIIQHQDLVWHATKNCFHCSVCKVNLLDHPYLPKKGLILCSKDCAKVAKAKDMYLQ